jgi:hypothetical protein
VSVRLRSASGYAMLAALLITVLAAVFALTVVAAVRATQDVATADADAWRATGVRARAVGAALVEARWRPGFASGDAWGSDVAAREAWTATWAPWPSAATSSWLRRRVDVVATHGAARRRDRLVVELRAEAWATGVTCSRDAQFEAPFIISGSGLYAGGCVRGREHVQFVAGAAGTTPDGTPADCARDDDFAAAAVHATAGIFAEGVEIHDAAAAAFPDDGDRHTGLTTPETWLAGPSAGILAAAEAEAEGLGGAYSDGTLRLDAIAPAGADDLVNGRCLLLPPGGEVVIEGSASPDAGRLLVLVRGDAVVGQPGGAAVELDGALVVLGRLVVRGELALRGSLHAESLLTEAEASVTVDPGWRERLLPGAVLPVVVEAGT